MVERGTRNWTCTTMRTKASEHLLGILETASFAACHRRLRMIIVTIVGDIGIVTIVGDQSEVRGLHNRNTTTTVVSCRRSRESGHAWGSVGSIPWPMTTAHAR